MISFKYVIYGLLIYLLYKFIFEIVLPVKKGVKSVRKNMEQMQRQQEEAFKRAQNGTGQSNNPAFTQAEVNATIPKKEGRTNAEYIDFEEVKK